MALGEKRRLQCTRRDAVEEELLRTRLAQHVFGSGREIIGAVRDVAIDRPPFVRAAVALVVHAPGVVALRNEPFHRRRMRAPGHVQIEGGLRGHRRAVHEENRAARRLRRALAPEKKLNVALAGPVFGAVHSGVIYPRYMQESGGLAIGGRVTEDIAALDTFPKLLMHHARVRPERPAIREKDLGIWQTWTWREFADEVRDLAAALAALRLKPRGHFAPGGHYRPRFYATMAAGQCLGAIPVPLYQ